MIWWWYYVSLALFPAPCKLALSCLSMVKRDKNLLSPCRGSISAVFSKVMCLLVRELDHRKLANEGRPVGRGVHSNPPFGLWTTFIHCLAVHFKFFTVCRWSTSLAVIENHRCPNEFSYNYAPNGPVRYTHLSSLCRCNTCVKEIAIQSGAWEFASWYSSESPP